jgi:hypothetical protein
MSHRQELPRGLTVTVRTCIWAQGRPATASLPLSARCCRTVLFGTLPPRPAARPLLRLGGTHPGLKCASAEVTDGVTSGGCDGSHGLGARIHAVHEVYLTGGWGGGGKLVRMGLMMSCVRVWVRVSRRSISMLRRRRQGRNDRLRHVAEACS